MMAEIKNHVCYQKERDHQEDEAFPVLIGGSFPAVKAAGRLRS